MRQKLTLITFGVRDIKRSVAFYESGLGWKRSPQSMDELILFPLGGMVLALYPVHELADDVTLPFSEAAFSGTTLSFNAVSEAEVDAVMAEAVKAGAGLIKPAQKVFWGGYSGYFSDPDGHLIEVAYNPGWALDAEGNLML